MPKNKKESSSSTDSDSGPEDRNPPPSAKKAKVSNTTSKKSSNNDEPKNRWILEKLRFVTVSEFRGRKMVDIREHYEKNGEYLPGKKGISLSIPQWKKLLEFAEEINQAVED